MDKKFPRVFGAKRWQENLNLWGVIQDLLGNCSPMATVFSDGSLARGLVAQQLGGGGCGGVSAVECDDHALCCVELFAKLNFKAVHPPGAKNYIYTTPLLPDHFPPPKKTSQSLFKHQSSTSHPPGGGGHSAH